MSHDYRMVQWNPFKKVFDVFLAIGVVAFLAVYALGSTMAQPAGNALTPIQLGIRMSGTAAFILLTLILCIGPLARLSVRFNPALYNRRHAGVLCFFLVCLHAALVILWYHGFSTVNPFISLLISNPRYESIQGFPFESLGLAAFFILFLLAATSHDFWNAILGPSVWKALHMGVYFAYVLVVGHIMLGAAQSARFDLYAWLVAGAALFVCGLHLLAAVRERARDSARPLEKDGWMNAGVAETIDTGRARILTPPKGERIAIFRDQERFFALSNVCRHQGGPLGEGRIVDGCVVCPWHGFQYQPHDGCSPPPFTEKVSTYQTRIFDGILYVHAQPFPPGTPVAPSIFVSKTSP
ncbi:hypothetical protein ABAC402_11180 [Asticcacaulis sp. AC402]|nr:hypothetical protein ABAC402_11180 [Asticcacaulis sp. AC402]